MDKDSNNLNTHIHWVCFDCGKKALSKPVNRSKKQFSISTVHKSLCDVCGETKPVTETRDFGYPIFD